MAIHEKDAGHTGGDKFVGYGGHRLWIAPEEAARTLQPDNTKVEFHHEGDDYIFKSDPDINHIQKEIRIQAQGDHFVLIHRLHNFGAYPVSLAPWSPTQCAGGTILFPQAPHESHADRLLPTRPLVMWGYSKLSDPRWTWGDQVVRLRHDPTMPATKIGTFVSQGYAACVNHGEVFFKRFPADDHWTYPDMGCNFEAFTRQDMIEIESLGPVQTVRPGDYAEHTESWYLVSGQTVPDGDSECAAWLSQLASTRH